MQDLRFLPWFTGPWERGGEEGIRRQPFVYRVRFDARATRRRAGLRSRRPALTLGGAPERPAPASPAT